MDKAFSIVRHYIDCAAYWRAKGPWAYPTAKLYLGMAREKNQHIQANRELYKCGYFKS